MPCFGNLKDIQLIAGFYSPECWDTTPMIWTKPELKIEISQNIESLSIKLFSPQNQTVRVVDDLTHTTIFPLVYGWNTLDIVITAQTGTLLSLTCEKEFRDPKRILGIAVQSIEYTKDGNKFNIDINDSQKISAFIKAKNVHLLGQISDDEKTEIFKIADLALNPMTSGSGTNIKVLGYLSAGIPTITTPTGARGLNLIDRKHVLISDLADFPNRINELLEDNYLAESLKKNGRDLVEEKFDWDIIVNDMSEKIAGIVNEKNSCCK